MKHTIKTIFLFFTAALLITSCGEDSNPPTAGFSMSDMNPIQWGKSTIASTAIGADEITYSVSPSSHIWIDAATIQFLEDTSYTITQTVINEDGEDSSSLTVVVTEPDNMYTLDGTDMPLTAEPEWIPGNPAHGTSDVLKFKADVEGQENPNHINLSPVLDVAASIDGTYTYEGSGENVNTYLARVVADYAGGFNPSEWTTDFEGSNGGSDLVIELVYEDPDMPEKNIYDIRIDSYTLSTGWFDFANGFVFVPVSEKSFTITYRGLILPFFVAP